ncbi:MAG: VWA domain-containing protein [Planctomycetaceae bacterium]
MIRMLPLRPLRRVRNHRRGAMLIVIATMMILFMVFVAFAIDVAHMYLAKTELRSATDAAAKAAAQELSKAQNIDASIRVGASIAAANNVNHSPLRLTAADFAFGRSLQDSPDRPFGFNQSAQPINSVRVRGQRTQNSQSGSVPLFFGQMFGVPLFEPRATATATYRDRDVVLVVDRSGSMQGTKFSDLRNAINVFVNTLSQTPVEEFVGLASYSDTSTADVPLTQNLSLVGNAFRVMPVAGLTSISGGMDAGESVFRTAGPRPYVEKTMIVMTDGNHNRGQEPRNVAVRLADDGVVIHTITFGSDADLVRMQEVAQIAGGRHFHASNGLELQNIYREIALSLSTMMTQ